MWADGVVLWNAYAILEYGGKTVGNSDEDRKLPAGFSLLSNYPNPFNSATTIMYVVRHLTLIDGRDRGNQENGFDAIVSVSMSVAVRGSTISASRFSDVQVFRSKEFVDGLTIPYLV